MMSLLFARSIFILCITILVNALHIFTFLILTSMYQLQENIDLFFRTRNNLTKVLNEYVALIVLLAVTSFMLFSIASFPISCLQYEKHTWDYKSNAASSCSLK